LSKQTAAPTDFVRVRSLAQAALNEEIMFSEGPNGPGIMRQGQTIAELLEPGLLSLKCPADQKVLLLEISPHIYGDSENLIGQDVVLIHLAQIGDEELSLRLSDAVAFCRAPLSSRE
jgi:hypothetical protein